MRASFQIFKDKIGKNSCVQYVCIMSSNTDTGTGTQVIMSLPLLFVSLYNVFWFSRQCKSVTIHLGSDILHCIVGSLMRSITFVIKSLEVNNLCFSAKISGKYVLVFQCLELFK